MKRLVAWVALLTHKRSSANTRARARYRVDESRSLPASSWLPHLPSRLSCIARVFSIMGTNVADVPGVAAS